MMFKKTIWMMLDEEEKQVEAAGWRLCAVQARDGGGGVKGQDGPAGKLETCLNSGYTLKKSS